MKSDVVVLVGPMGVGKTTIGRKLSKVLKLRFVDTDSLVVAEHGPIPDIFEKLGEVKFRQFEEGALALALQEPGIVATGGGAVLSAKSQKLLKNATVVYLATNGRHIGSRLKGGKRPLIKDGVEAWRKIYEERKPVYKAVCDFEVDTSGKSLATTVAEIRELLTTR